MCSESDHGQLAHVCKSLIALQLYVYHSLISFLFVNIFTDVEEGGETAFPNLNLSVKPKKGRGLLWPSTLNANPELQDPRTMHEARPVLKGTKYAANSWIHLYDYAKSNLWGCTGSFDDL